MIKHSSGKSAGYGEIASAAAELEVPQDAELKDPKDFKIIGRSKKNVDAPKIVTGQPLFGLDTKREGMQIAMIVHPPAFGMKIKSVDDTEAKAVAGISDVVVVKTEPSKKQWSDTNAFPELVAVVGKSTWQVMKAKKALKVEWVQDTPAGKYRRS